MKLRSHSKRNMTENLTETQTQTEALSESGASTTILDSGHMVDKSEADHIQNLKEKIPLFDPDAGIKFESWLSIFNKYTNDMTNEQKLNYFKNFLKNSALTFFINSCAGINNFELLINSFREKYLSVDSPTFTDFNNVVFKDNLQNYFTTKVELGRKLNLTTKMIIEGLIEGLRQEHKAFFYINPPQTTADWLMLATKVVQNNSHKRESDKKEKAFSPRGGFTPYNYRPVQFYPQSRPQQFSNPSFPRFTVPTQPRMQVRNIYQNNNPRMSHFSLPPNPCKYCFAKGIINAFHWGKDCKNRPLYESRPTHNAENVTTNNIDPTNNHPRQ